MSATLLPAITFGLAAGLNPGPLGVFVLHQTITRGNRYGLIASLIPFFTDIPIVLLILLLSVNLGKLEWFTSAISIAGAIYLLTFAKKIFYSTDNTHNKPTDKKIVNWLSGVKLNILNPIPYIFWGTVGSVYIINDSYQQTFIFVLCLLSTISITKFTLALLIKTLGDRFNKNVYTSILKILSIALVFFSAKLLFSGLGIFFT